MKSTYQLSISEKYHTVTAFKTHRDSMWRECQQTVWNKNCRHFDTFDFYFSLCFRFLIFKRKFFFEIVLDIREINFVKESCIMVAWLRSRWPDSKPSQNFLLVFIKMESSLPVFIDIPEKDQVTLIFVIIFHTQFF